MFESFMSTVTTIVIFGVIIYRIIKWLNGK